MQTLTLGSFYLGLLLLQVAPVGGEQSSHLVARSTPVSHRREPKTLVFSKRVFTFLLFACLLSGKKTSPDQDGEDPLLHPLQPGLGDRTRAHLAPFQLRVLTLAVFSLSLSTSSVSPILKDTLFMPPCLPSSFPGWKGSTYSPAPLPVVPICALKILGIPLLGNLMYKV